MEHDGFNGKTPVWSEPEISLYDDDPFVRMSYPCLIEEDGRLWISETNKSVARLHAVSPEFLNKMFAGRVGGSWLLRKGLRSRFQRLEETR